MSHTTDIYSSTQNLATYDRIISAVFGSILIGFVFTKASGIYLGWMALLPIVATYPCLAALTGYSPIRALFSAIARRTKHWPYYIPQQESRINVFAH